MTENKDYELIPNEFGDDQLWDVRILTGDYTETVIRYGALSVDEETDMLHFNFDVVSSPIDVDSSDENLQEEAMLILEQIIHDSVNEYINKEPK